MSSSPASQHKFCVVIAAAMLAVVSGCGLKTSPVSGTVSVGGQAVGPGTVIFLSADPKKDAPTAMGHFGADGQYQLSTRSTNDGAAEGKYRVVIQDSPGSESSYGEESPASTNAIPLLYADPKKSGLTAEVRDGANTIDFDL